MLTIKNLDKTYANGVHALDNVSLEISNGMFGLLGPNGAGKSTLMRTIATLQPADSGSIQFNGIDVLKKPDEIRRTLGYLPQDFGVYQRISAEAMLDHMAILKGIVNAKERKRTQRTAGLSIGANQSRPREEESPDQFFRWHAPALRYRTGPDWRSEIDDCG